MQVIASLFCMQAESRVKTVTELVESLCEPSAESSLLELSRGEAKDIKVPSIDYAESQPKILKDLKQRKPNIKCNILA